MSRAGRWLAALAVAAGGAYVAAADMPPVVGISAAGERAILEPPVLQVSGVTPDVVIVEYFDYNCGYCKKYAPTLDALRARDPRVTIVYKDWPILGPMSVYAARAALAAQWQGKYTIAHDTLLAAPHLTQTTQIDEILRVVGIDLKRLAEDRQTHAADIARYLARNDSEARALELRGTPGILIGRQLVAGMTDLGGTQQLIAAARRDGRGNQPK